MTLEERMNKKLLEATTWYKDLKEKESTDEDQVISEFFKSKDGAWKGFRNREKQGNNEIRKRKKIQNKRKINIEGGEENKKVQAVVFVYHTKHSKVAKRMRKKMES